MKKVAIIDYGIGNVKSMMNAIEHVGANAVLTNTKKIMMDADACILPGVGAFKHGMENLIERDLPGLIKDFIGTGKPFLGVCLGMQLLFEESDEFGITPGLGLIKGKVRKLALHEQGSVKLPHVGWNELEAPTASRWQHTILHEMPAKPDVYFVHSYVGCPEEPGEVLANCNYGAAEFCAAVYKNNMYGTQFHPEKSGPQGMNILRNFIELI